MAQETQTEQKEEEKEKLEEEYKEAIKEIVQLAKEEEEENEKKRKKLRKVGLVITFAYHCNRCNYTWFPKDFDAKCSDPLNAGSNIIHEIRPKSCARCKSKQWYIPPTRKTKHNPDLTNPERWTKARILSEFRRCTRNISESDKRIKHLQDLAKKDGIRLD